MAALLNTFDHMPMNTPQFSLKGIYRDVVKDADERVVHDSGWVSNTIVAQCRILLAGFMKNDPSSGIQFLGVGRGEETWDTDGVPPSEEAATDLVNRFSPTVPVADLDVVYLDDTDEVQADPSPRIQVTATLEPGYPEPLEELSTYPLREFGLFGRFNGADFMINSIRHPVIHKDEAATLIRVVRLYF